MANKSYLNQKHLSTCIRVIIIKNFNVVKSFPAQALAAPFWFHIFFITAFFKVLAATFLQLGCFCWDFTFLEINTCII